MQRAKLADLGKVSLRRDDDPCFALNGLNEERSDVLSMELESSPDVFDFTISNKANRIAILVCRTYTGKVWAEGISVCAHAEPCGIPNSQD